MGGIIPPIHKVNMTDNSNLDQKYFIDYKTYNCPFCNRKNVIYSKIDSFNFDWNDDKKCYGMIIKCSSCNGESMHLSYKNLALGFHYDDGKVEDLDSEIFYHVPTSFFAIDNRIPKLLRELISEAEGSLKMNYLTGASACTRKCIYELLVKEKCIEDEYREKIKSLKVKFPDIDPTYFDILNQIQGMTSDKIHEQSWDKWNHQNLKLILETLKNVLYEIYVTPEIKKDRVNNIKKLFESIPNK